jgi:hypothetical protein
MKLECFLKLLDELFEQDPGTMKASDSILDHERWCSLTFMGLIALVDSEYGFTLDPSIVLSSRTATDVHEAICASCLSKVAA